MPSSKRTAPKRDTRRLTAEDLRDAFREKLLVAFFKGTAENEPQWWSCRLCSWTWRDGSPEAHESGCLCSIAHRVAKVDRLARGK